MSRLGIKSAMFQKIAVFLFLLVLSSCKKDNAISVTDTSLSFQIDGTYNGTLVYQNVALKPNIVFQFTEAVSSENINQHITLQHSNGAQVELDYSFSNNDRTLSVTPRVNLASLETYELIVKASLKTKTDGKLINPVTVSFTTVLNLEDKFPRISDEELRSLVQKQTCKYFCDFAHPVSGMARERNTSGNL